MRPAKLPDEIVATILAFSSAVPDLVRCGAVCRQYRRLIAAPGALPVRVLALGTCRSVRPADAVRLCERWCNTIVRLDVTACQRLSSSAIATLCAMLTNLRELVVAHCPSLTALQAILRPISERLVSLDCSGSPVRLLLPPGMAFPALCRLRARLCSGLAVRSISEVNAGLLEVLDLSGADILVDLPRFTRLRVLSLATCKVRHRFRVSHACSGANVGRQGA